MGNYISLSSTSAATATATATATSASSVSPVSIKIVDECDNNDSLNVIVSSESKPDSTDSSIDSVPPQQVKHEEEPTKIKEEDTEVKITSFKEDHDIVFKKQM